MKNSDVNKIFQFDLKDLDSFDKKNSTKEKRKK